MNNRQLVLISMRSTNKIAIITLFLKKNFLAITLRHFCNVSLKFTDCKTSFSENGIINEVK